MGSSNHRPSRKFAYGGKPPYWMTDLAHHDPFTTALKSFGNKPLGKELDTIIEIQRDGKSLSTLQLEKEYQDWIIQMHDGYDEEIDCGEDEPVLVIGPRNKKRLVISSDVVRVHKIIRRKGSLWKSGQKVKILKGAVGCSKNNIYATLEYILLEGFQGDVGGEARLICRPLGCSDDKGCMVVVNDGNASLDIHDSLSLPISLIDSGKFQAIDLAAWNYQLEKRAPSRIDILTNKHCHQLEIQGELPLGVPVSAGYVPPNDIVAVIRPVSFTTSSSSKNLDQKYIVKDDLEMSIEVRRLREGENNQDGEFIHAERIKPSSRSGYHGLYIFSLGRKHPKLFCKAGVYTFSFSVDMLIKSTELDMIRPNYEAVLEICSVNGVFSASAPCKVLPGPLASVKMQCSPKLENILSPGYVIEELVLEVFDAYGNHIERGVEVHVEIDGLRFQDHMGSIRKVDDQGYVNLSGLLEVVAHYGSKVCVSVSFGGKMFLKKEFQVVKRELRVVSGVPGYCSAGSRLENVVFEVCDSNGVVDEAIHGQCNTLTITSESLELDNAIQYTFRHGWCIVPAVPVPREQGTFRLLASHTLLS